MDMSDVVVEIYSTWGFFIKGNVPSCMVFHQFYKTCVCGGGGGYFYSHWLSLPMKSLNGATPKEMPLLRRKQVLFFKNRPPLRGKAKMENG